jgi:hypothetical protein
LLFILFVSFRIHFVCTGFLREYESFLRLSAVRCEKYGGRSEDVVDGSAVARNSAPIKERHDQRLLPARLSYGKPNISVSLAMQVWFFNSL